jgi:tRNA (guanine-N7-)-methyltransferase
VVRPVSWRDGARRIVDIGCGDGQFLVTAATSHPENDYLGIERIGPLLERAATRAKESGATNARFIAGDAVAWLFQRCGESTIDEIHVYHPQPYYDPAEAELGMLSAAFFERVWQVLKPEGVFVFQTDNKRYGKYLLEAAGRHFEPNVQRGPWPDAPQGRTQREGIALGKKLSILRVVARRRDAARDVEPPPPYFDLGRPGLKKRRLKRLRP